MIDVNTATTEELINYIIERRQNLTSSYRTELESKTRFQIQFLAMKLRRDQEDEDRMNALANSL